MNQFHTMQHPFLRKFVIIGWKRSSIENNYKQNQVLHYSRLHNILECLMQLMRLNVGCVLKCCFARSLCSPLVDMAYRHRQALA